VLVPTNPPFAVQMSPDELILQREPQSRSVWHAIVGSETHVNVVVSHVSVGMLHVTKPSFPHVERAAQRVTFPLQFVGIVPSCASWFTMCATQLTYRPWFVADSHGHSVATRTWTAQRAGSQSGAAARAASGSASETRTPATMASFMVDLLPWVPVEYVERRPPSRSKTRDPSRY
jgi:hypothetical protein